MPYRRSIFAALLMLSALAVAGETGAVRFTEGGSLLKTPEPGDGMASCQPLRGDTAQVVGVAKALGTDLFHLRVLSGRCKASHGWAGISRVEAADTTEVRAVGADVRFTESASLLKTSNPSAGMADCQPIRGDTALRLSTVKAFGTEITQLRVLSGRCAGVEGWAGVARIESLPTPQ